MFADAWTKRNEKKKKQQQLKTYDGKREHYMCVCLWRWVLWFKLLVIRRVLNKMHVLFEPVGWFVGRSGSAFLFIFISGNMKVLRNH